jgi:GNAT superfamily N-acetyltransferase
VENYKIIYQDELTPAHNKIIIEGLNSNAYRHKELGKNNGSFSFTIESSNGQFEAGISGFHYYGCFYIDLLFVAEQARGKGYGSKLMQKAENLARERGCLFMAVNTMDFEAKPFYEKHGFSIEFTREGFEKESKMYFLRKEL